MTSLYDHHEPSAADLRLERALREQAPLAMALPSRSIRAGVVERLHAGERRPAALRARFGVLLPLTAAAGLGLVLLAIPGRTSSPVPSGLSFASSLDPTPVIRPAGRLVAGSIDQPLRQEASLIARDTRRAVRLVVDSLPRPGVSRAASPGGG